MEWQLCIYCIIVYNLCNYICIWLKFLIKLLQLYLERITSKDKTGKFMTGNTKILQWTNKIWPISGNKMKGSCSRVSGSDFNFSSVVTFLWLLLLSDRIRSQKQKISLSLQGRNSEFLKKPWEWLSKSNIILIGIHWLDCLWLAFPFF